MYKIYINDTPLLLVSDKSAAAAPSSDLQNMVTRYTGNAKSLLNYHDMLEKNTQVSKLTLYSSDVDQLFQDFCSQFKILEAGGGVVYNPEGQMLLIYRRKHWDLPKGKIEKGESREAGALREVEEEAGLSNLELGPYIKTTYHTYRNKKNKRVLKVTHWYRMNSEELALEPQAEEDIELAEWKDHRTFLAQQPKMYGNIKDLLKMES